MPEHTLPPRPDPQTGEPFPPHAPAFTGNTLELQRVERYKPDPPPGMGPPLAWHQELYGKKVSGFFSAMLLVIVLASIISLLQGDGLNPGLEAWPIWLIIVVTSLLIVSPMTIQSEAAGADWFQARKKRVYRFHWCEPVHVCTYDLVKVEAEGSVLKWNLDMVDRFGNRCLTSSVFLQTHRHIWDLVYNGIAHSVANGAKFNNNALVLLQLEATPALAVRVEKESNGEPMPNRDPKYAKPRDDHWNAELAKHDDRPWWRRV